MLCFVSCILNCTAYVFGWIALIVVTLKVALGRACFQSLRDKAFAYVMEYCIKEEFRVSLEQTKNELFASMKELKPVSDKQSQHKPLNILEIGVGTGTNLEFYPAGSRLLCVDPNQAFEVYFRRECVRKAQHLHPEVRFVTERGESMPSVADDSVDVVVSTLVMCSVTHLDQMFREIRRVLAPGGKYYFLEHVGHPVGSWRRRVQNALSDSDLWPAIFDRCVLNKDVEKDLLNSGFSKVDRRLSLLLDKQMKPLSTPMSGPAILNPFLYGEATK